MTGPGTDQFLFENDDAENDDPLGDEADVDDGDYGADDEWPAEVCHPLYDGS